MSGPAFSRKCGVCNNQWCHVCGIADIRRQQKAVDVYAIAIAMGEWAVRTQRSIDSRKCDECWMRGMQGACWKHTSIPEVRYP